MVIRHLLSYPGMGESLLLPLNDYFRIRINLIHIEIY